MSDYDFIAISPEGAAAPVKAVVADFLRGQAGWVLLPVFESFSEYAVIRPARSGPKDDGVLFKTSHLMSAADQVGTLNNDPDNADYLTKYGFYKIGTRKAIYTRWRTSRED